MSIFSIKKHAEKKAKKKSAKPHSYLHTLSLHYSRHLCALSSRLLRIPKRDDVYDNYASHDEEKRTDDEYREELLFVF